MRHLSSLNQAKTAPQSRLPAQTAGLALSCSRFSLRGQSRISASCIPMRALQAECPANRSPMHTAQPRHACKLSGAWTLLCAAMPARKSQQYARAEAAPAPRPARDPSPIGYCPAQSVIVRYRLVCASGPASRRSCCAVTMHLPLIPGKNSDSGLNTAANGLPGGACFVLVAPSRTIVRPRPRIRHRSSLKQAKIAPQSRLPAQTADLTTQCAALYSSRFTPCGHSCTQQVPHAPFPKTQGSETNTATQRSPAQPTCSEGSPHGPTARSRTSRLKSACPAVQVGREPVRINPETEVRTNGLPSIRTAGRLHRNQQTLALVPDQTDLPSAHQIWQMPEHPLSLPENSDTRSAASPCMQIVSGRTITRRSPRKRHAECLPNTRSDPYRPLFLKQSDWTMRLELIRGPASFIPANSAITQSCCHSVRLNPSRLA